VIEELMRSGSAGLVAGLGSLDIAIPPIVRRGTPPPEGTLRQTGY